MYTSPQRHLTCVVLPETSVVVRQSTKWKISFKFHLTFNMNKMIKVTLSCADNTAVLLKFLNGLLGGNLNSSEPKLNRHC